jgi:hypothetical protein
MSVLIGSWLSPRRATWRTGDDESCHAGQPEHGADPGRIRATQREETAVRAETTTPEATGRFTWPRTSAMEQANGGGLAHTIGTS